MSGRILIVDDNPLNIKLLSARLTREYYAVTTARTGAEALQLAQQEPPDLALLDVMMPDMNGYETCRRLRADDRTKHIPVIMITALSDPEDRVKGLEAGAQDFLTKPIHDVALFARVRSLLRLKLVTDEWRLRQMTNRSMGISTAAFDEAIAVNDPAILLLADDPLEIEQISLILRRLNAHIHQVARPDDARSTARSTKFDAAIGSLSLRGDDGLRICPALRGQESSRHLPILLIGDQSDYERVARGLDLGANDYLLHPLDEIELTARLQNQIRFKRSYDRINDSYAQNLSLALTDALTGCFNRRYFDQHLPRLLQHCRDRHQPLALLVVDVDHFKQINDRFGHAGGDAVLQELAQRLRQNLRPSDFVSRYGGEEFVIVLPETDAAMALQIAERLRDSIVNHPVSCSATHKEPLTISIGLAVATADDDAASLFQRADSATYAAKQAGRNCVIAQ